VFAAKIIDDYNMYECRVAFSISAHTHALEL